MESPLDFFRRNQKTLLPVIAIGCMVAFVVLPGLLGMLTERNHASQDRNPVLYRWQGGDLTQRELQQEINDHERLSHLYSRVNLQKAMLSTPELANNQQVMNYYYSMFQNQFQQLFSGPTTLDSAAESKIFDQLAKELGIVVTDQKVDQFLHQMCGIDAIGADGKPTGAIQTVVPAARFDAIMQDMAKADPGFTQDRLFELVKRMFARQEVVQIFSLENVFTAATPLARWDDYRRIRQRASIQAIPVNVSDFVATVRNPTEDELQKFFAATKDRLPNPNSAEVGLRTPTRASFQLAHLNMERLVSSFKPRIENKAITDYYEKNKATRYVKPKLPAVDPAKPAVDPATPMTPANPEGKEPAKAEAPKTEPAKSEPAKAEPAKAEPAAETPKTETPKADPAKKQSSLTRDGFLPVNFQADAKKRTGQNRRTSQDGARQNGTGEGARQGRRGQRTGQERTSRIPTASGRRGRDSHAPGHRTS
jgi:hypothetical protein